LRAINRQDPKATTFRHTIGKTLTIPKKERTLKAAREKVNVIYKGKPIRKTADYSIETLKIKVGWNNVYQALKENNCQSMLVYPAKLSFKIKEENKRNLPQ
jgi:hypothetical protein